MDLESLREFVKLAEYLNFTKTARELRMSQSSLSRHIQDLEKELGASLLNRGETIDLTYPGEILLDEAGKILIIEDRLKQRLQEVGRKTHGKLSIEEYHYSQTLTNLLLNGVNELRKMHPGISARFIPTRAGIGIAQSVHDGYFDLAIEVHSGLGTQEFSYDSSFKTLPLHKLKSRFCFYLSKENPLYNKENKAISFLELQWTSIVCPLAPEFYNFKTDIAHLCSQFGFQPNYSLSKPSGIKDLSMMNLADSVLIITEADIAFRNSIFLQNNECRILRCEEDIYATPCLLYRNETNKPLELLVREIEKVYGSIKG